MTSPSNLARPALILIAGLVAVASVGAAPQLPAPRNTGTQIPRVPGAQIPLLPEARQFLPIPETKEFPKPQWWTLSGQPTFHFFVESPPVRMVCHMVVVPVNPDVDPRMLVPVPENAPKGIIKIVEPPCEPTPRR